MLRKALFVLAVAGMVSALFIGQALSQESRPGRGGRGGPGGRGGDTARPDDPNAPGGPGRFNPSDFVKTALGTTDEEWKVLQPKVEKVQTLARQARGGMGMMGGRMGRGGPGGRGGDTAAENAPTTDMEKKAADLQKVIQNKEAKPDEIASALKAYRAARVTAREELVKAQKDLQELVTPRQEAVLVSMGLLE